VLRLPRQVGQEDRPQRATLFQVRRLRLGPGVVKLFTDVMCEGS
jgi:hypothetical protein